MKSGALLGLVGLAVVLAIGCGAPAATGPTGAQPPSDARTEDRAPYERLSLALRGRRLSNAELAQLEVRRANRVDDAWGESVDRWLTRDAYHRIMQRSLPYMSENAHARRLFFTDLGRRRDPHTGEWVYAFEDGRPLCPVDDRSRATPWWAVGHTISICNDSYRPAAAFDGVGYCAGQPEPSIPAPRRAGCGCGPLLLGCLPPSDESPSMAKDIDRAALDEYVETATEIASSGRSLDELLTTSTTWQSGLARFLYERRNLIAMVAAERYSDDLERRMLARLKTIDLAAPGAWTERDGVYAGSGLFVTTPLVQSAAPQYRSQMRKLLEEVLCVELKGLNVSAATLLHATAGHHANLRSLKIHESPMRTTVGCNGCHAPMDFGAAFLVGLRTPLFGAFPTEDNADGQLFVLGSTDHRGDGSGFAELGRLIVKQPEFETCMIGRTWRAVAGDIEMAPGALDASVAAFRQNGHRMPPLLRSLLAQPEFRSPVRYVGP